jgi:drug/metabolite transporter (DMT)-like permease
MSSATIVFPVQRGPSRWALWGSFAVIYLVWGSTFLGIRVAVETLPPLSMAAVRFLISGAILMAASARVRPRPTWLQWRNAAIVGAFFFLGNHGLMSSAARFIPSSLACLIISSEVAIIAVLSSLLLPDRPLTGRSMFGAALGLVGVLCLFVGKSGDEGSTHLLACAAVVGASLSWSFGAVFSQRLQFPSDAVLRAGMQMTCGGIMLSLASLLRGEPAAIELARFSERSLGALAYLIVFGSVLAFACYSYLLKNVRAEAVATHVFVNPLVAVAVGVWLGGEQLRPAHLVSGVLILASVFVIILGPRRIPSPVAAVE